LFCSPAVALSRSARSGAVEQGQGKCAHSKLKWTKRESSKDYETPKTVKKIFFINVDGQHERKLHMEHELKKKSNGVPFERFKAFAKNAVPNNPKHPVWKLYSKGRYTPWLERDGQKKVYAAIHFSNYQVMEKILKEDPRGADSDDVYMIMEDDATLAKNWDKKLNQILSHTPKEWDMLRVGYWGWARCEDAENEYVYALQPPSIGAPGSGHFYSGNTANLVKVSSIPKILDIMRNSSVASIENVLMYPHRFPDGSDQQVLSYAVNQQFMLVQPSGGFQSSH